MLTSMKIVHLCIEHFTIVRKEKDHEVDECYYKTFLFSVQHFKRIDGKLGGLTNLHTK